MSGSMSNPLPSAKQHGAQAARQQVSQRCTCCIALPMARRMALLLGSGFTHFFRLTMTFLTFYAP